jgi:hypothetical protein
MRSLRTVIRAIRAIDGVTFEACYPQRISMQVGDITLPIIDLANFRRNKQASGRAKDLADLESLDETADEGKT